MNRRKKAMLLGLLSNKWIWSSVFGVKIGSIISNLPGARSNGNTFNHSVNTLIEFIMTTVGDTARVEFRKQGDDDCYYILFFGDGSYVLYSTVLGSVKFLSGGGVVTSGQKISIVLLNNTIKIYSAGILKIDYSTALEFQTMTVGQILYLGAAAISDLKTYRIKV